MGAPTPIRMAVYRDRPDELAALPAQRQALTVGAAATVGDPARVRVALRGEMA